MHMDLQYREKMELLREDLEDVLNCLNTNLNHLNIMIHHTEGSGFQFENTLKSLAESYKYINRSVEDIVGGL